MTDFDDDFDESIIPNKPETPIQYLKLEDSNLVKRDLDTFPDLLKDNALDKYKVISFIEKELSGGWTQKNIDPILEKLFENDCSSPPSWRTV